MRPGLRPRVVRQIFAPVPAARSRCLASFVAIARQGLPAAFRYEPSHVLAAISALLLFFGFLIESFARIGSALVMCGWGAAAIAAIALLFQDKIIYGQGRPRLIRQLDEVRKTVGLDEALLPESLEFLETTAQQWERIDHALQAQVWKQQEDLKSRIADAAHRAMEDILVLECGTTFEAGLSDEEADQKLSETSANLRILADTVDATAAAIMTYPRDSFESNGASPEGVSIELDDLESILQSLGA